MKLLLKRIARKSTYTIGKLYINDEYFCDTIEDKDRGLDQEMSLIEIKRLKIKNETAIPTGTYEITLDVVSPKFSKKDVYKYINGKLPRLLNVKGYGGVLIHIGNTAKDSAGCILVGRNTQVGKVLQSTSTFKLLYSKLLEAKKRNEKITITVK